MDDLNFAIMIISGFVLLVLFIFFIVFLIAAIDILKDEDIRK